MSRVDPLLIPGDTCWRIDQADRVSFLVDGADYFAAVKQAMLSAKQSIWLLAWVFAREQRMDDAQYAKLVAKFADYGYDPKLLKRVPQFPDQQ